MTSPIDSIALHARLTPHRLAARDLVLDRHWSYAELDDLVGRLAALLLARGCVEGERLAVLARNSVWQVALHFACGRVGAIYVPLNWRLSAAELDILLQRAEPCLVLGDEVAAGRADVEALAAFVEDASALAAAQMPAIAPERVSLILFTSGTSGQPKGVMLSEGNLQQTAQNFGVLTQVDARSSFLCEAPMFHVIGLVTNVRPALAVGGSIQVSNGFEPERTLNWLCDRTLAITHYVGVPQMMQAFRHQPGFDPVALRHLTALVSGGAPHAGEDLLGWLEDGIPMVCGYGMSEAGTVFGMSVDQAVIRRKLGAVGISTPAVQTRVLDADGNDCQPEVAGELLLRGPNLSPGYWRDPHASAEALDAQGWFHTGDIVRRDADGFFWVVDRKKDMFISGGENVYPAEIEATLADHPQIRECAVVGIADPQWGEVGYLAIVPAGPTLDLEQIREYLIARLAKYKVPKHLRVVQALPRTATGKLQKAQLKRSLTDQP
ncbi:AMP-binding protein [Xanthomonas cucurbitae]|uniref:AMP-binding protein n=1 Tax=Xanthomonas cucurbitae TaxID=56453 RepID=A0A2S7DUM4_9XANT|nr:AMP-binding protein [Xanthomonas cucurbitae]PPU77495.1 acyl-CoA synthetase [Xanthomonas cucurbitae]WDM68416.1 AMP-binding protein [Xanthomonas cucurbitae]WDM72289.1 AMP-binding protein [Xanthomonas cucurbitae]WDM78492.1 AMP-binding protein [Xanthomonas cucurbitae]WDM82173.1 AMP-binding protein [Xanthomonas cucurbitae]